MARKKTLPKPAPALLALLAQKYGPPEWAFFDEIGDAAGYAGRRRVDGVAMGLFPSRGCRVLGFEIKAHRGDWIRELKDPGKAEAFFPMLDGFYIVANDGVVENGELPPGWGLLTPYGRGLKIREKSEKVILSTFETRERLFVAAMMRKLITNKVRLSELERRDILDRGIAAGKRQVVARGDAATNAAATLRERIRKFEDESGVKIDQWRAGEVGRAVKIVLESGTANYERQIKNVAKQLTFIAGNLESLLDGNDQVRGPAPAES